MHILIMIITDVISNNICFLWLFFFIGPSSMLSVSKLAPHLGQYVRLLDMLFPQLLHLTILLTLLSYRLIISQSFF